MKKAAIFFVLAFSAQFVIGQEALKPRPSPLDVSTFKYDDTYIKVTYSRPHKNGRDIFGSELVPFGEVWRTGANEATEITITGDIFMKDSQLPAGSYTLFTIPEEKEWTIILNNELGQWGEYRYEPKQDYVRFKVPVEETDVMYEPFTIEFEQEGDEVSMNMMWDRTMVSIPIYFEAP